MKWKEGSHGGTAEVGILQLQEGWQLRVVLVVELKIEKIIYKPY